MCMAVLPVTMCALSIHSIFEEATTEYWIPWNLEVTNGCELPWGFWELNPRPLQEQKVLFTAESLSSSSKMSIIFALITC